jgi:hypothetical protein
MLTSANCVVPAATLLCVPLFIHSFSYIAIDTLDQESKQTMIELKDDDPDALTSVLRYIYKLLVIPDSDSDVAWRTWLNIRVTADKYLEPQLSEEADKKYREAALSCISADDIFDVLETIWSEMSHDESLAALGEDIRRNNLGKLLKNARFREHLDRGGKEALWAQLDELAFSADLRESRYTLCNEHKREVFKSPEKLPAQRNSQCSLCTPTYYSTEMHPESAWI